MPACSPVHRSSRWPHERWLSPLRAFSAELRALCGSSYIARGNSTRRRARQRNQAAGGRRKRRHHQASTSGVVSSSSFSRRPLCRRLPRPRSCRPHIRSSPPSGGRSGLRPLTWAINPKLHFVDVVNAVLLRLWPSTASTVRPSKRRTGAQGNPDMPHAGWPQAGLSHCDLADGTGWSRAAAGLRYRSVSSLSLRLSLDQPGGSNRRAEDGNPVPFLGRLPVFSPRSTRRGPPDFLCHIRVT